MPTTSPAAPLNNGAVPYVVRVLTADATKKGPVTSSLAPCLLSRDHRIARPRSTMLAEQVRCWAEAPAQRTRVGRGA